MPLLHKNLKKYFLFFPFFIGGCSVLMPTGILMSFDIRSEDVDSSKAKKIALAWALKSPYGSKENISLNIYNLDEKGRRHCKETKALTDRLSAFCDADYIVFDREEAFSKYKYYVVERCIKSSCKYIVSDPVVSR